MRRGLTLNREKNCSGRPSPKNTIFGLTCQLKRRRQQTHESRKSPATHTNAWSFPLQASSLQYTTSPRWISGLMLSLVYMRLHSRQAASAKEPECGGGDGHETRCSIVTPGRIAHHEPQSQDRLSTQPLARECRYFA